MTSTKTDFLGFTLDSRTFKKLSQRLRIPFLSINRFVRLQKLFYTNSYNQNVVQPWRFNLYQRPSSVEVNSFLILVFATVRWQRGKNLVVHTTQCVATFVPVYRSFTYLPDTINLFYPSGPSVWFPAQHCHPVRGDNAGNFSNNVLCNI